MENGKAKNGTSGVWSDSPSQQMVRCRAPDHFLTGEPVPASLRYPNARLAAELTSDLYDAPAEDDAVQRLRRSEQCIAESRDRHQHRTAHVRQTDREQRNRDPDRVGLDALRAGRTSTSSSPSASRRR